MSFLADFSDWILTTRFSVMMQNLTGAIPVLQSIHLLSIAVVVSSSVMINLRLAGLVASDQPLRGVTDGYLRLIHGALVVLLLTGALLISAEPARSLLAFPFQLKMVTLVIVIGGQALLQRRLVFTAARSDLPAGAVSRLLALGCFGLWLVVIAAGRWIAYA